MAELARFISAANGALWGAPLLILLAGAHVFLTVRTRGVQRHLGAAIRLSVARDSSAEGDVSPFGALATALAATVGTGNIVGVASAVALGGPGAVLWCWLTGIFGMATKYGEGLLAVKYRVKTSDGTMLGGPMYALERGVGSRRLASLFAVFAALASFGIGSSAQAGALSGMLRAQLGVPPFLTALVAAALAALVILGGVKSITRVCALLVPFMAAFYAIGCVAALVINAQYLSESVALIFRGAFSPRAAAGGCAGGAMLTAARYGVARGLFSNESGLGSAPIAAAAARTESPVRQALVSMTGTFWDTVVLCAMTGLVIVSSAVRAPGAMQGLTGGELTSAAFARIPMAPLFLTIALGTFAFSTILGWSYYGERCVEYLLGKRAILPYRTLYIVAAFFGGVLPFGVVWDLSDILNGLMAAPNLISLFLLSGVIAEETRSYFR
ncbi:MAG: amino acid carrier protein [Oscillospiraceae bacterium]|jgi:AGCS family alanine or glycine:cation symporter|nr:amino acid carrier protein [Oscillospiraceae bacterium]